jgi:hypothetical protein
MDRAASDHADRGRDRRTRRSPFYFPERRSGFDRRRPDGGWAATYDAALRNYRDRSSTFLLVLATIVVFNFIDYFLTVRVLEAGGVELNPVMARLFAVDPVLAAIVKIGVGGAAALWMLLLRRYKRSLEASIVLLLGFTALMFYHAYLVLNFPA